MRQDLLEALTTAAKSPGVSLAQAALLIRLVERYPDTVQRLAAV